MLVEGSDAKLTIHQQKFSAVGFASTGEMACCSQAKHGLDISPLSCMHDDHDCQLAVHGKLCCSGHWYPAHARTPAAAVWDSSIVVAKYLEKHQHRYKGKRCLDLSAGCGLVGELAHLLLTAWPHGILCLIHMQTHCSMAQRKSLHECCTPPCT